MSGGGHGKRHKKVHEEEHENHERWMVSYADMLTLLFVLFVVLFAISQVDQRKFAALKNGLAAGFGAASPFDGGTGVNSGSGVASSEDSIKPDMNLTPALASQNTSQSRAEQTAAARAVAAANLAKQQQQYAAAQQEVEKYAQVKKRIKQALADQKLNAGVRFTVDSRGLVVTIVTSSVVFAGDSAALRPAGQRIVAAIAPALRPLKNNIEVDGHTNQLPVPTRNYPTAWELSTARASAVVRFLVSDGLPASRMSAAGYAGERPLYPPSDPRAVTLNRRVEVIVLSALPAEESALLPSAAPGSGLTATPQ
jgi:chemotaxis protein MotB